MMMYKDRRYIKAMEQGILPQCSKRERLGRMCIFNCYYTDCPSNASHMIK